MLDEEIRNRANRPDGQFMDLYNGRPVVHGCETPEVAAVQAARDRGVAEARAKEEEDRRQAKARRRIANLPVTSGDQERIVTNVYDETPMIVALREWANGSSNKSWLMLCGPVGRGKTFACAAWLASVDYGDASYVGARELERLSMSKFGEAEAAYKSLLEVRALVIDDVGREDDLGRMQTALLDLVDMRRRRGMGTVLATNFSRKAFCERYSDARLQSRLAECAQWFADVGEDMRRPK